MASEIFGTSAGETISGDGDNNTIYGSGGDDTLQGRNGHDVLHGGGGNDVLNGGSGGDTLDGGNGHDDLDGGLGNDTLEGGNGRDILRGSEGDNTLTGGNGDDTFVIDGNLAGLSLDTVLDFDVGRQVNSMTYWDDIELYNVGDDIVTFSQAGNDVELYIGNDLVAIFKGSTGTLLAADVMASVNVVGIDPISMSVSDGPPDFLI